MSVYLCHGLERDEPENEAEPLVEVRVECKYATLDRKGSNADKHG